MGTLITGMASVDQWNCEPGHSAIGASQAAVRRSRGQPTTAPRRSRRLALSDRRRYTPFRFFHEPSRSCRSIRKELLP